MQLNTETAGLLIEAAVSAVRSNPYKFCEVLDELPAAVYVTNNDGVITYFNQACVDLAGRTPVVGSDKWCVTWKLFTDTGEYLPHADCPMATALRENRPVRNVEAIAERPDGSRFHFVPFPTPFFDEHGNVAGAVNLLLDITPRRGSAYLREQAEKCRRLAAEITDQGAADTLYLMAAKYDEQALRFSRLS
jgi:PAS domain S-box-containing protein